MSDDALLSPWSETVLPEWCDYNGHMNVAYYLLIFDHATDALWDRIGLGSNYRHRTDRSTFAVESHIHWISELLEGDEARCESRIIGFDEKRIHYFHHMRHAGTGALAATVEMMSLHVDLRTRKVCPMPGAVQAALGEIRDDQAGLPMPDQLGHVMRVPAKR